VDESSGKQGKGILVVDGEPVAQPERYGADRIFVYLRQDGSLDSQVEKLRQAGHPALIFEISGIYDLGAEFYRWEVATSFACAVLGVNAFDQPDVQDSKNRTVKKIEAYKQSGKLEEGLPIWNKAGIRAFSNMDLVGAGLEQTLQAFLGVAQAGKNYVAINAYIPRNPATAAALTELRLAIRARTGCATTVGFGRVSCIPPVRCTRAGRIRACSCRLPPTSSLTWRFPPKRCVLACWSAVRPSAITRPWQPASGASCVCI